MDKTLRFFRNVVALDTDELLRSIGGLVEGQTALRITDTKKAPDGSAWPELSEDYEWWKFTQKGDIGMLEFDGNLRDNIVSDVSLGELAVGSNQKYAAKMQLGSKDGVTPARPFLGLSDQNKDDVNELIRTWMAGEFGI